MSLSSFFAPSRTSSPSRDHRVGRTRPSLAVKGCLSLLLAGGVSLGLSAPADAHVIAPAPAPAPVAQLGAGVPVLQIAEQFVGVPYVWGGTTPAGFDCSGYTSYVYRQVGVELPRTAREQRAATLPVAAVDAQPGDLVFFVSNGRVYHNGIYAGDGYLYDSPRAGKSVSKRKIWTTAVTYGRVLY